MTPMSARYRAPSEGPVPVPAWIRRRLTGPFGGAHDPARSGGGALAAADG